LRYNAFIMHAP